MAKKKLSGLIKLQVPAGKATPAPPIGTALGPKGINIMEFCKAFNAKTQKMEAGTPIPVEISYYTDRSFTFIMKSPPNTYYIKKALKLDKGHSTPGRDTIGKITMDQLLEIAKEKIKDTNAYDEKAVAKMLAGSAISMGIEIIGE